MHPPFSGGTLDTMTAVLESGPLPPSTADVPPALARIVELSLKKDPESRLSAEDVAIALRELQSQPEPTPTVPAPVTPANPRRFLRVAAVLGAVALAAALGFWLLRPVGTTGMPTSTTPPSATPSSETPGSATPGSAAPASPPPAVAAEPPSSTPPAPTLSLVAAGPRLAWFNREGTELGSFGEPGDYGDVSLSPDGTRVAVSVREPGSEAADIWVFDVASGAGTRVTGDPADDIAPVWSVDGSRIVFASSRAGSYDLYERAISDTGTDTSTDTGTDAVVVAAAGDQVASDVSSDGRYLVYQTDQPEIVAGGNFDLWARGLPGGRPFAFLRTVHAASRATFSPDGSQIAYGSLEGGREDVYVAQFPRYDGRRAALYAVVGALVALHHRDVHGGKGQVVDAALYESVFAVMESLIPEYSRFGYVRERSGASLPGISPSSTYTCRDSSYVVIGGNSDGIYQRLMRAIDRPDLAEDPALARNEGRVQKRTT